MTAFTSVHNINFQFKFRSMIDKFVGRSCFGILLCVDPIVNQNQPMRELSSAISLKRDNWTVGNIYVYILILVVRQILLRAISQA